MPDPTSPYLSKPLRSEPEAMADVATSTADMMRTAFCQPITDYVLVYIEPTTELEETGIIADRETCLDCAKRARAAGINAWIVPYSDFVRSKFEQTLE